MGDSYRTRSTEGTNHGNRRKNALQWAVAPLIALGAALFGPSSTVVAQSEDSSSARGLEGTWLIHLTQKNCATGTAGPTFPALLTFARGGTTTETNSLAFQPGQRIRHGTWRKTSGKTYLAHDERSFFSAAGPSQRVCKLFRTP